MSATLYLRPQPRAFYLLTETNALVFRQPDANETKASRSVVVAEFLSLDEVDMRGLVRASEGRLVEGVLGVTSVPTDHSPIPEIFLLLVSSCSPLSPLLPSSSLRPSRVTSVEFHSLSSSFWDSPDIAATTYSQYPHDIDLDDPYVAPTSYHAGPSTTQSQASAQGLENPCNGMRKYLESGGFFYAEGCKWDISTRMGESNWVQAEQGGVAHPLETFDERFVWNTSLLAPLLAFRSGLPEDVRQTLDEQSLIIPVIQGFCGSLPVSTGSWTPNGRPEMAALGMISRLSWKRAGARFRTRGIDDEGQVANFVETELILATDNVCLSYTQVRGSVPLFWQQPSAGLGTLQQRVEINRPPQATQPAFDKHFLDLMEHYRSVHAVNLLGQKDAESMLSCAYSDHLAALKSTLDLEPVFEKTGGRGDLSLTPYDFHQVVRANGHEAVKYDFSSGLREVVRSMDSFGWTAVDRTTGQIIELQNGVFRVNCLDCLDRTNYIQDVISSITLSRFLDSIDSSLATSPTISAAHRELWADNGDRLSKIYAGTGALNTSATRSGKKTFAGLLSDATKSVGRAYINNFQDKHKQTAIDMLLGMMAGQRQVILFDPISDSVQSALASRVNEYSKTRTVTIFSGTWNLNGKAPEALDDWLFPANTPEPDIYAISFQEIVELTAGQILQTDPAKRRMWEKFIVDTFAMRKSRNSDYILYRSEQLVGTALIVFVKADLTGHIRRVESATKKTGLQGLSGNKGGVGIRLDLFDSSICLMTCHLAAGHTNVTERNADYRTISNGLKFLRGKRIEDHDIVIWAADFNYRISMPNLEVRDYAQGGNLNPLLGADQLMQAMDDREVFVGYDEGPISFPPTYKYDNGTDSYDTTEKARIPAWTDRILFKGSALRLKDYNRADLRTSDHRPVYAVFEATIREVDHVKKDTMAKEILKSIRADTGYEKIDLKVEKASNGGITSLVRGMTHVSSAPTSPSPSRLPYPARNQKPRLPPPRLGGTLASKESIGTVVQGPPLLPPRPTSATPVTSPPFGPTSSPRRKPAPPEPTRSPVVPSSSLSPSFSPGRRPAPPVPGALIVRSNSSLSGNSMTSPVSTSSPTLTPASTGDFMIVSSATRPPPLLPPRVSQQPRPSLDLNGPPPDGLVAPVVPDNKSAAAKAAGAKPVLANETKKAPPAVPKKPVALRSASNGTGR